jgi:hypothetical protein
MTKVTESSRLLNDLELTAIATPSKAPGGAASSGASSREKPPS